ncbi:hypothetical protein KSC_001050 [Ktedonobacter sp. SOSP1-52]|uniref:LuxR C-terminal-related transcriptional regulator n=1 Tax=Ktedonobacter sp. SOSP1-52 TaxID=2778366 RepID=UPI0019164E28|nr:LuxR C-terminal-related transcriptional regulator [Ktedonobacter sp. SOSP1-52]GHO61213.1 hypothetical protein KSC_001050 [Ktedonobacter sp. SOSP1-52]
MEEATEKTTSAKKRSSRAIPNAQLKEERLLRGWSQQYVAEQLGADYYYISRWERGTTSPSPYYRQKLCTLFGKTARELGLLPDEGDTINEPADQVSVPHASLSPIWNVPYSNDKTSTKQILRPLTKLIGRQRDIERFLELFTLRGSRLFTIVGTVGVGKTQFALQVASALQSSFPDGVCTVFFDSLFDHNLILSAILRTLGITEVPSSSDLETLCSFLHKTQMLLLLDTFEHVRPAASFLPRLLDACPGITILVTSRAGLNVRGEQQFPLSPLDLPNFTHTYDPEALAHNPAVALFLACTRTHLPQFQLTPENVSPIVQICAHLGGLPLAIELAATTGMQLFPPKMLLKHLEQHPLHILVNEEQDIPERQRTWSKTIDRSYSLLLPQEQRLFRRLAIFSGGATLEALEDLYERLGEKGHNIVRELAVLTNHRLVISPSESPTDLSHFRMLQVIRAYGRKCLDVEGETNAVVQAYTAYFLQLAKEIEPQLIGAAQLQGLDILEQEQNNFRAVFTWLVERNEIENALDLTVTLWRFWSYRGYVSEGYQQIEQLLKRCQGEMVSAAVRAKAYYAAALLAFFQLHTAAMKEHLQASLKLYREVGERHGYAIALNAMGFCELLQGHDENVKTYYEESFPILQEMGDRWHLAEAYALVAREAQAQGNYVRARKVLEQSLVLIKEVGDRRAIVQALDFLGQIVCHLKEYETALHISKEKSLTAIELGEKLLIATSLEEVGAIATIIGQETWAAILLGAGEALRETSWGLISDVDQRRVEDLKMQLRAKMNEETLTRIWAQGRAMTPKQALLASSLGTSLQQETASIPLSAPGTSYHLAMYPDQLTQRQVELLRLLAEGLTDKEIAARLSISPRTVNAHLNKIYPKIHVSTRSAATRYAVERKLI